MIKSDRMLSVIVPIYGVEKYLREALDSVIAQDIGFTDKIQLVLVNDGSPDNSGKICAEYKGRFPDNVVFITQRNQGVSVARNRGLEEATGKYIAFFDPDDKLSKDAYRRAIEFFEVHYDMVDFVSFKMKFFERLTGDHPLNYRFEKDGIIDIRENPTFMQSSSVSCVFKAKALKNRRFDTKVKYAEDMKLLNQVILERMAYGVVTSATYYVRKRIGEDSASNLSNQNKSFYTETPVRVFKYLFDLWENKNGVLDEYIQFVVLFDLQWRINQAGQSVLTELEVCKYKDEIYSLIRRITNDGLILHMPKMRPPYKLFLLKVKYGDDDFNQRLSLKNKKVFFGETCLDIVFGYSVLPRICIEIIRVAKSGIHIEGYISGVLTSRGQFKFRNSNNEEFRVKGNRYRFIKSRNVFLGEIIDTNQAFSVDIKVDNSEKLEVIYDDNGSVNLELKSSRISGLANIAGSYKKYGSFLIKKHKRYLAIRSYTILRLLLSEVYLIAYILVNIKLRVVKNELLLSVKKITNHNVTVTDKVKSLVFPLLVPAKAILVNLGTVALRLGVFICRPLKRGEIWLVSDRINAAGDNGEAFFDYMHKEKLDERCYFAISKSSSDYQKLIDKKYRVVNMSGIKYKFLVLMADKIISSNADELIFNPFFGSWSKYVDLMNFKFIFLQHGITKDDISKQYNKWNTGFAIFITASKREYDSIVNNKSYGLGSREVKLTGFPRFDKLHNDAKGKIIFLPTWRHGLDGGLDKRTGKRLYSDDFINTSYFKFYSSIISHTKLRKAIEKHNMIGEFCLHPSFEAQTKDFTGNKQVVISEPPYDFQKIFSEGSILVTDYSSVSFDFSYLKKPVIYSQFDESDFFNNHTYKKGYFSYSKDGFGPVTTTVEATVNKIIECIEAGSVMSQKYIDRVNSFFEFNDTQNSKRVYLAIKSIKS